MKKRACALIGRTRRSVGLFPPHPRPLSLRGRGELSPRVAPLAPSPLEGEGWGEGESLQVSTGYGSVGFIRWLLAFTFSVFRDLSEAEIPKQIGMASFGISIALRFIQIPKHRAYSLLTAHSE